MAKIILALILLAGSAFAQTPVKERFQPFNASDAAYWAGAGLDVGSSLNKREAGIFRDKNGVFAPAPNLAFKAGLFAAFKALEWRYDSPKQRRLISWTKIGVGIAFGAIAAFLSRVKCTEFIGSLHRRSSLTPKDYHSSIILIALEITIMPTILNGVRNGKTYSIQPS